GQGGLVERDRRRAAVLAASPGPRLLRVPAEDPELRGLRARGERLVERRLVGGMLLLLLRSRRRLGLDLPGAQRDERPLLRRRLRGELGRRPDRPRRRVGSLETLLRARETHP